MAIRRMLSKKIIDTDFFLDLPATSQILYFHLALRADDDGFISAPKRIMRMVGSAEDDYKLLIAKEFVIPFETGVCVIKHWRVHNYIQKDRYTPTFYKFEKSMIEPDPSNDNAYIFVDTECIQPGHKMLPQVRLGKVRLELGKHQQEDDADTNADLLDNQEIIADLLESYWSIEGACQAKGDFAFMERCYNEYGFHDVIAAINKLGYKMEGGFKPDNPLMYLKAIMEGEKINNGQPEQHLEKPKDMAGKYRKFVSTD